MPRRPLYSEKLYASISQNGDIRERQELSCWQDKWYGEKRAKETEGDPSETGINIEESDVFVSLVVPAFNEEARLNLMLVEAINYLQEHHSGTKRFQHINGNAKRKSESATAIPNGSTSSDRESQSGWEILVVSDGSTDKTVDMALQCAKEAGSEAALCVRVIRLEHNRGKGGAVTHGMRHVRGRYAIFADADGASKFEDLGKLVRECRRIEDANGRAVAVGSRAHLVGSEAVVKVSQSPFILPNPLSKTLTALILEELPHAFFPSSTPHFDTSGDRSYS